MLTSIATDLRYAARAVLARPAFGAIVVATLALGIGVNVALFSLVEQILLRPLAVAEPERLVNLSDPGPKLDPSTGAGWFAPSVAGGPETVFSYPMFRDLEREQQSFAGIAAHHIFDANVATGTQAVPRTAIAVSGSYFGLLGIAPALGRLLGPDDDGAIGQAGTVVVSHAFWESELAADPGAVGRRLVVNGAPLTIVGVAPAEFRGTTVGVRASLFVPITFPVAVANRTGELGSPALHDNRGAHWLHLFARLAPGVTREEAAAALEPLYRGLVTEVEGPMHEQGTDALRAKTLVLEPGAHGQSARFALVRDRLQLLFAVGGAVLLLCCANVGGLMLVRGTSRIGEMAVRASLGATRARLASLLLAESLLLVLPAAIASLPIAALSLRGLASGVPGLPRELFDVDIGFGAALAGIAAAAALVVAFAFVSMRDLARTAPGSAALSGGARHTSGKRVTRFRAMLATAQVALSMALVATCIVLAQSLANIARTDLGLDVDSVVVFSISPGTSGYTPEASASVVDRLEEALASIPGVTSAAWSAFPLFSGAEAGMMIRVVEDRQYEEVVSFNYVSTDFFRTLGIDFVAGRGLSDADAAAGAPRVGVVNRPFAERFGIVNTLGVQIRPSPRVAPIEIVGVIDDVKYGNVTGDVAPQLYLPRSQMPQSMLGSAALYLRGATRPEDLLGAVRAAVTRVDPLVPIANLRSLRQQARENVVTERFVAGAATACALLATALAGLGLFGVLAYFVSQRSREIGLRVALGARPLGIRALVLRQVAGIAVFGLALGVAGALWLREAVRSLLFGVGTIGILPLTAAAAGLFAVIFLAAYFPARRAARMDPMAVLRQE